MSHKHFGAPDDVVVYVEKGADNDPGPPRLRGDSLQVLCDDEFGCWVWKKVVVDVDGCRLRARLKWHEEMMFMSGSKGRRGGMSKEG